MKESKIQSQVMETISKECQGICARLNAGQAWGGEKVWSSYHGCYIIKNPRPIKLAPEGFSDLVYFGENRDTVFIEVKTEKGKTRPAQERFLALMRKFGHSTAVVRSAAEAVNYINNPDRLKR